MSIRTVSLSTAKLLKEAGFRQDNMEFYWSYSKMKKYILNQEIPGSIDEVSFVSHVKEYSQIKHYKTESPREWYAAPTTDELLESISDDDLIKYHNRFDGDLFHGTMQLVRNPDYLAKVCLWLKKEELI